MERMKELIQKLNYASYVYYTQNTQIMTDKEWDELFDELKQLESETGIVLSNSPTQNVGYSVVDGLDKVTHSHPMLSLDKTKSVDDLKKFSISNEWNKKCILSCKMDGLTVLLTYENGELVRAETRGNGIVGEDITHNAKVFSNIPLKIPNKHKIEIEGEAIITYKDFEKINSDNTNGDIYRNPRNLASGTVRQLNNQIAKNRNVKFIAWKVPFGFTTMIHGLRFAEDLGFEVVPYVYNPSDIENAINYLKDCARDQSYPIDGLVMTYNNIEYGKSLGITGHHPKHSIAFKFYDEEYETELINIEWTMGKTGVLTPTAVFKPVEIDGTIVERASLHNITVMYNTLGDLPHIGQRINVAKMNMIIPQVVSADKNKTNVEKKNLLYIPKTCPICGHTTIITQDGESAFLACDNQNCTGKLLGKLSHFVSREAINIDGLSETTLQRFITLGFISDYKDIYHLKTYYNQLLNLDGLGKKSVDKLLDNIEKSRNTTLKRFIYSLSIDLIGNTASKLIENEVNKLKDSNTNSFTQFCKMISQKYNWTQIDGFGEKMQQSLTGFFDINLESVKELANEFNFESSNNKQSAKLDGLNFVITGSVYHFVNRKELQKFIENHGGKVIGSVSAKTNYLINNDINSNSSKNKKAKSLNIPIITEDQFIEMINK